MKTLLFGFFLLACQPDVTLWALTEHILFCNFFFFSTNNLEITSKIQWERSFIQSTAETSNESKQGVHWKHNTIYCRSNFIMVILHHCDTHCFSVCQLLSSLEEISAWKSNCEKCMSSLTGNPIREIDASSSDLKQALNLENWIEELWWYHQV